MGGLSEALNELRLADHMVYVTFPLLNDKQIVLNAISHLGIAMRKTIKQFLRKELEYKRVKHMPSNDLLINEFIKKYGEKLGLESYTKMLKDVTAFNNMRDRSSIKLKRNDKFIVISPEYSMKSLSLNEVKDYLRQGRKFINKINELNK